MTEPPWLAGLIERDEPRRRNRRERTGDVAERDIAGLPPDDPTAD
jgi:hypothetical protein